MFIKTSVQFSRVRLFVTPRMPARQASLPITNARSSLRLTSIDSVTPSSHLILCRPLLLLPPIIPSIRVFSNESTQLVSQSCPTLCDPMDCSLPGSSVNGISQARILECFAIPFSRRSFNPGTEPRSPALQGDSLPSEPPGKPL